MIDRLTERDEYGNADIIGVDSVDLQCNLAPEEFNKVTKALNRLADYEDDHERRKFLWLPCRPGDTVYNKIPMASEKNKYVEYVVKRIEIYENAVLFRFTNGLAKDVNQIGVTIFLTKEEAEQALEQMGE